MNKFTRCTWVLICGWLALAAPLRADNGAQAIEQAVVKAREESIRRQELLIRAEKMIREADDLAKQKNYLEAATTYEQVLKYLPKGPASERLYQSAVRGATDTRMRLANEALRDNDLLKARENANKVLEINPDNRSAQNVIQRVDRLAARPEVIDEDAVTRVDRAPEILARDKQIEKVIREGRLYLESGLLDEAEVKFRQAIVLDEYNTEAMRMLKRVFEERQKIFRISRNTTVAERMDEVAAKWLPPIRKDITLPKPEDTGTTIAIRDK